VPAATPFTTPVLLIVATEPELLLQIPPGTVDVRLAVPLMHITDTPVMVPADVALTVITCVAVALPQPVYTVYVIVAVPAAIPVAMPVLLTVAIAGVEDVQIPPVVPVAVSVVAAPTHIDDVPVMVPGDGGENISSSCIDMALPQLLVTE